MIILMIVGTISIAFVKEIDEDVRKGAEPYVNTISLISYADLF